MKILTISLLIITIDLVVLFEYYLYIMLHNVLKILKYSSLVHVVDTIIKMSICL